MHTISVTNAKTHLSKILDEIKAGKEVIITRRGKPIVRIVSLKKQLKATCSDLKKFRAKLPKAKISSIQILRR